MKAVTGAAGAGRLVAAVATAIFVAGCGGQRAAETAPDGIAAPSPVTHGQSPPASRNKQPAQLPDNFVDRMSGTGFVLEPASPEGWRIDGQQAVTAAIHGFHVFVSSDPVIATPFLVTTPDAGEVADPSDPDSLVIKPELDHLPCWVVYARTRLLKDENQPDLGYVKGTAVVFVNANTGTAEQALTY
ncbi:MAG: hypothetical protein U0R80_16040 [Nocardioidaceae bacterium]